MKGIDISSSQGNVNFDYVKNAGYEVVYIKATEGLSYINPYLNSSYKGANAAGLKIGFYHFLRANDPIAEAQHFLQAVSNLEAKCKYSIDCETTEGQSTAQISTRVRRFADYLISQGKEPCLYTGEAFYKESLDSTVKDLPLWVAHYGVSAPGIAGWVGFQYSDSGSVSGVNNKVDLDTFTDGILLTSSKNGWYLENNIWRYYKDGSMIKNGWAQDSKKQWFWLDGNGDMLINGWVLWKDKWYFFGGDGAMFENKWAYWKGKQYYLGADGAMLVDTVTPDGYLVNEKGEWDGKEKV
ncbi:MAG: GH25 family lysozyme [Solirubrobacterales bacterium]